MPDSLERLYNDIESFIGECRRLLKEDALLEMEGFDARVQELCTSVMGLTQDERLRYADRLQHVLNELTLLGQELQEQRDRMAEQLLGTGSHRKANVAYRTTEAIDGNSPYDNDSES